VLNALPGLEVRPNPHDARAVDHETDVLHVSVQLAETKDLVKAVQAGTAEVFNPRLSVVQVLFCTMGAETLRTKVSETYDALSKVVGAIVL
jgi:hypothetical protein